LVFFTTSPDSIFTAFEIAVTPPPAVAGRLDSAPYHCPKRSPPFRKAPARADRPFKGIALVLASTIFLGSLRRNGEISLGDAALDRDRLDPLPGVRADHDAGDDAGFAALCAADQPARLHLMRGAALLGSSLFFISGLRFLPIAEASATGFVAPLFVTALSIIFLGEKVGLRRWIATAVGLIGVLIILRPGTGAFHPAAFFPLVSALAWACTLIMTRMMSGTERAITDHDLFVDRGRLHSLGAGAVRLGDADLARHRLRHLHRRRLDAGQWIVVLAFRYADAPCWRRSPTRSCCGSACSAS
jgi:hypothetical protein